MGKIFMQRPLYLPHKNAKKPASRQYLDAGFSVFICKFFFFFAFFPFLVSI